MFYCPSLPGKPLPGSRPSQRVTPPQRPVPTIHQTHIFANFLSPPRTPKHVGETHRAWSLVFGAYLWSGWEPDRCHRTPSVPLSRTLPASVCRSATGPGGFLYPPRDRICCICWREGGVRGGARGTVPGTEQKMSKRRTFAGSDSAADGGISISGRTAASKVFQAMLLIAFAALELESAGGIGWKVLHRVPAGTDGGGFGMGCLLPARWTGASVTPWAQAWEGLVL